MKHRLAASLGNARSARRYGALAERVVKAIEKCRSSTAQIVNGAVRSVFAIGARIARLARDLVAEDRRFAMRGGSLPLLTTPASLRQFGLVSLPDGSASAGVMERRLSAIAM
jgi:hypothetical protein